MTAMSEFRCAYFAKDFDATLAFYRNGLGLDMIDGWDRGPEDRGAMFAIAGAVIEIIAMPLVPPEVSPWDYSLPNGIHLVIEVPSAEEWYELARVRGVTIRESLKEQSWGQRSVAIEDPNGVILFLFERIGD